MPERPVSQDEPVAVDLELDISETEEAVEDASQEEIPAEVEKESTEEEIAAETIEEPAEESISEAVVPDEQIEETEEDEQ